MLAVLLGGPAALPASAQDVGQAASAVPAGEAGAPAAPPPAPAAEAPPPAVPAAPPAGTSAPKEHDLTPTGMFLHADPVVQGVMIVLMLASMASWVVLLVKGLGLWLAKGRLAAALAAIRTADSLAAASHRVRKGPAARLLLEAEEELGLSQGLSGEGIKERAAIGLQRIEAASPAHGGRHRHPGDHRLDGPFVGLFGTVWGIMNSFVGIAQAQHDQPRRGRAGHRRGAAGDRASASSPRSRPW